MTPEATYSIYFIIGATVLVSLLLPIASSHPDGLEKVAENLGFIDTAEEVYTSSPIPDYDAIGDESYMGAFLANIVGIILTLALGLGIGYIIKK